MLQEQIKARDELMAEYGHIDLKWPGYPGRTTAAEVMLRCAANEIVFARWWQPAVKRWNNKFPMEIRGSVVGDYLRALRTGDVDQFNARLYAVTDPDERRKFITIMNLKNTFLDDSEWMRNVDEVLYAAELAQSGD